MRHETHTPESYTLAWMTWEEFSGCPEYYRQQKLQNRRAAGRCHDAHDAYAWYQQNDSYGPCTQKGRERNQGPYAAVSNDENRKRLAFS